MSIDERTTGLILRTRPLTETSLIVEWLTRDLGRLSTVAKGARRPKSTFTGKLDLFYLADLSFCPSRRGLLHTLREVIVRDFHPLLRRDLAYLQQASYFAQFLQQTTEPNTPLPGLFELLLAALDALPQNPSSPLTVFAFETKLLEALGLGPRLGYGGLTAGSREILGSVAKADWVLLARLRITAAQSDELDRFLREFIIYHFGKLSKSRTAAVNLNPAVGPQKSTKETKSQALADREGFPAG